MARVSRVKCSQELSLSIITKMFRTLLENFNQSFFIRFHSPLNGDEAKVLIEADGEAGHVAGDHGSHGLGLVQVGL